MTSPHPFREAPGGDLFAREEIEAWLQDRPRRGKRGAPSRDIDELDIPAGPLTQGQLLTWLQLLYIRFCLDQRPDPTAGAMSTVWQAIVTDPDAGRDAWRTMIKKEEPNLGADLTRALTPARRIQGLDPPTVEWIERFGQVADPVFGKVFYGVMAAGLINIHQYAHRAGPALTSRGVALLVAELLSPLAGTLYDPAFGMGTILDHGWSMREDDGLRICGQEVSVFSWKIAFLRLLLHGAEPELRTGDTLLDDQFRSLKADRIALDPPWGARRGGEPLPPDDRWPFDEAPRNSEWLWVHHMLFHLSDQGRDWY